MIKLKVLSYKVKKQHLMDLNEHIINPVQHSLNYLILMFKFVDEDWDNTIKRILFKSKNKHYEYVIEEIDEDGNYYIKVPNFLLKTNGFQITLIGIRDDIRITTNTIKIYIEQNDYTDEIIPPEPEVEDIITYILKELVKKQDKEEGKGLSEEDFTTILKTKLDNIEEYATHTIIDDGLDENSINPVQNKIINGALNLKADETEFDVLLTQMTEKVREL